MTRITPACILVLLVATTYAKPMSGSVKSWEGDFKLKEDRQSLQIEGKQNLLLWRYQLEGGSQGSCIGFSSESGEMILAPQPNEKGVQPVYSRYVVLFGETDLVEIIVTYAVQGNGDQRVVETYTYDGRTVNLASRSQYFGKHEPVWRRI